ncbi:MAG: hypothetical protein ACC656_08800 [Candidatus Heimdallarchaeota archaeon]
MSSFLNESNMEITIVTIPEDEMLSKVEEFVSTMGYHIKNINHPNPVMVIKSLNARGIIIKGTRNEAHGIAKQLGWKMQRKNPPKK